MSEKNKTNWRPWIAIGAALWGLVILIPMMSMPKAPPSATTSAAPASPQKTPEGYYRNYKNELVKNPTPEEVAAWQKATETRYPAPPEEAPSDWSYTTDHDEMRNTTIYHACVTSSNQVRLERPYEDQATRLCIRKHPQYGTDVIVRLTTDGQFLCSSYQDCIVRIKFGDGAISSFSAVGPSDGDTDTIFIRNASRFLTSAKGADQIIIEAEFYRAGVQQMKFSTAGLIWPPKKTS